MCLLFFICWGQDFKSTKNNNKKIKKLQSTDCTFEKCSEPIGQMHTTNKQSYASNLIPGFSWLYLDLTVLTTLGIKISVLNASRSPSKIFCVLTDFQHSFCLLFFNSNCFMHCIMIPSFHDPLTSGVVRNDGAPDGVSETDYLGPFFLQKVYCLSIYHLYSVAYQESRHFSMVKANSDITKRFWFIKKL